MVEVRPLAAPDGPAAFRLGSLAFGYPDRPPPSSFEAEPGRLQWGAFDADGRLVGKAVDRELGQWFGGRVVPSAGIAGVATAPHTRGQGVARAVLTALLAGARGRGAVISSLFDTTPFPYRRLGWEEVGARTKVAVPTASLAVPSLAVPPLAVPSLAVPPLAGRSAALAIPLPAAGRSALRTRAATPADLPRIRAVYEEVARASTGMLTRVGPQTDLFATLLADWHGVSVVEDGYLTWDRGEGYGADSRLEVGELVGLTPAATSALLDEVAGWAAVAPTTTFRLADNDPVRWHTTITRLGTVERRDPWMLRLIDVAGAVAARGFNPVVRGRALLTITDEQCPWNTGTFELAVADGSATLTPGGSGGVEIGPRGLALWYAGAATPFQLRRLGLLAGPTDADPLLAAATAGPPPTLLDYF